MVQQLGFLAFTAEGPGSDPVKKLRSCKPLGGVKKRTTTKDIEKLRKNLERKEPV